MERKISPKVKAQLQLEPDICLRKDEGDCKGRITKEIARNAVITRWNKVRLDKNDIHNYNDINTSDSINKEL